MSTDPKQCFKTLKPVVKGKVLVMEEPLDNAAYYGLEMLEQHKFAASLLGNDNTMFAQMRKTEPEDAMHVCTTVSLSLVRAGLGDERYYTLVKQVLRDNPELTHGFPITHFVDVFFQTLHKQLTSSPTLSAADRPNHSSTASSDNTSTDGLDGPQSYRP